MKAATRGRATMVDPKKNRIKYKVISACSREKLLIREEKKHANKNTKKEVGIYKTQSFFLCSCKSEFFYETMKTCPYGF